jgi:8-oxo-dGTP pyrophosphatase MutT (NUDIX family)
MESLREIFLRRRPQRVSEASGLSPAGVLVPLFRKDGDLHLLLTQRTETVKTHKGQIAFPGGKFQYEDLDCLTTALRETEEEVGIAMDAVEVLGELDHTVTLSRFRVCPFVGIIPYPYPFRINTFEVERLIELPLSHLSGPEGLREGSFIFRGESLFGLHLPYQGDIIWGATARIIKNFMDCLCP